MRSLANENFPGAAVETLRNLGHDVVWIRSAAPGLKGGRVLEWAVREARILVTFDTDFGELARNARLPNICGVLLLRIPMPAPAEIGARLATLIMSRDDWAGAFSVIEPGRVRMRPLSSM